MTFTQHRLGIKKVDLAGPAGAGDAVCAQEARDFVVVLFVVLLRFDLCDCCVAVRHQLLLDLRACIPDRVRLAGRQVFLLQSFGRDFGAVVLLQPRPSLGDLALALLY